MAEIPSDIASSAAQATFKARQVARDTNAGRAGQAGTAERQIKTVDEAGATVDTGDSDSQVFADAEGAGSQGREEMADQAESTVAEDAADNGITRDDDGRLHVDLEA